MVVVVGRGNVQHRVKREGNYPGGDVQGEMSGLQNSQPIVNLSHGMLCRTVLQHEDGLKFHCIVPECSSSPYVIIK